MVCDLDLRGIGILDRRRVLLEQLRSDLETNDKPWAETVGAIGRAVRAGQTRFTGFAAAVQAHDAAMKRLEATLDACGALHGEEHLMSQQLEQLRTTLAGRE
jgi:hypothetical protein